MAPNPDPFAPVETLTEMCLEVCILKGWSRDPESAGLHLHLEASEFIEALRGKKGDPVEEAGDVLFVLLSMMRFHGIAFEKAVAALTKKCHERYLDGPKEPVVPQELFQKLLDRVATKENFVKRFLEVDQAIRDDIKYGDCFISKD